MNRCDHNERSPSSRLVITRSYMSTEPACTIDLYIGESIEWRSEQAVLRKIVSALQTMRTPARVFCNFHVKGRQIDFLVVTTKTTLVMEAKTFAGPVWGRQNGEWERRSARGRRSLGNPYLQVLGAKNALRDAMRELTDERIGHPDACIVVEPRLPNGSDVDVNDHKVTLIDADQLMVCLNRASEIQWALSEWDALASHLALRKVPTVEAACSPKLLRAQDVVDRYTHAFHQLYAVEAATLLPDVYRLDGTPAVSSDYVDHVVTARRNTMVMGPSGCGKSLLAIHVAVAWQRDVGVCLFLAAKYFETGFKQLLDRDLGLLDTTSATLFDAVRRLGSPLLLIVDGYNEVSVTHRLELTRSLRAIALRYDATILVTGQENLERPDLLELAVLSVSEPSSDLKHQIACAASHDKTDEALTSLLACVSSGLEARLMGEVGGALGVHLTGPGLCEAYIRRKLGDGASQGIALLSRVSAELTRRLSFSLSMMELDRLASEVQLPADIYRKVSDSRILVRRGSRVSFWHELFLTAFAAEAAVRDAHGDAQLLLRAINDPRYDGSRRFIVAAIDDDQLLETVLNHVTHADLLIACSEGKCGRKAQLCLYRRLDGLWVKAMGEARHLQFEIVDAATPSVRLIDDSVHAWESSDFAALNALARKLADGPQIERLMDAAACLDETLASAGAQLRKTATTLKVPLRSRLFELAYIHQSSAAMLPRLLALFVSGVYHLRDEWHRLTEDFMMDVWSKATSTGQRYILLTIARWSRHSSALLPLVMPLLSDRWRYQPYHMQLELLNFAHSVSRSEITESLRSQFIAALEGILEKVHPLLAGMVLESLQQLGALASDEMEHLHTVQEELRDLLRCPRHDLTNTRARYIFDAQFDHPFASAYFDAIEGLTPDERKQFFVMACDGTESAGFFLSGLIQDLVATGDLAVAPSIAKWTQLPEEKSVMPQEALRVFIQAHLGLAALRAPCPTFPEDSRSAAHISLRACGELCYWLSRQDLPEAAITSACERSLQTLLGSEAVAGAAGAVMLAEQVLTRRWSTTGLAAASNEGPSLLRSFPHAMREIGRRTLSGTFAPVIYFSSPFDREQVEVAQFAIEILAVHGDDTDLHHLRSLSENKHVGVPAIQAIKAIEQRIESPLRKA